MSTTSMFTPFTEQNFDTLQRKNSSAQRVADLSGVPVEKSFTPDELRDAVTFGNVRAFYYANEDEFPMEERVKALEHDPLFPLKCRAFRKISRVHEATFFKWIEGLAMTDVDDSVLSDADLSTDLSTSVAASFTLSVRVQEEDGHDASSKNCATIASIVEYHQKRRTLSSMLSSLQIGSVRGKHEPQVSVAFLAGFVFAFATTAGLAWSLGNSAAAMKSSSSSEQNATACQDAVDVDAAEEDKNNNSQQ
eukprot:g2878.t1